MDRDDLLDAFRDAATNDDIVAARFAVLDTGAAALNQIADLVQTSGWINRDDGELAVALLSRLSAQLSGGIAALSRQSLIYAAGALLRQLVEIEYLMFLGYKDPANLARWYAADARDLRRLFSPQRMRVESEGLFRDQEYWLFSPQRMRVESEGLFRDQEYWLHCEVGGHPHPRSRMLLSAYENPISPVATLLPDSVQHLRRLWTSLRLLLPNLRIGVIALDRCAGPFTAAIEHWTRVENPLIVSFDGIARDGGEEGSQPSAE